MDTLFPLASPFSRQLPTLDGRACAQALGHHLQNILKTWRETGNEQQPTLAILRVGNDPASAIYVASKIRQAQAWGLSAEEIHLPASTPETQLMDTIDTLNNRVSVHGMILQLPLPPHLNTSLLLERLRPEKDVDGLQPQNLGHVLTGPAPCVSGHPVWAIPQESPRFVPCTPQGILRLLHFGGVALAGTKALVIGRSRIVGMPTAALLTHSDATVTIAHRRSDALPDLCRSAQLIVASAGHAGLVRGDWIRDHTVVIDVGIHRLDSGKLIGDVRADELAGRPVALSPVPGGVGPMTVACLLYNTALAMAYQRGLPWLP